jgi:hypothetical protein
MAAQFLDPKRPTMKAVRLVLGSSSQQDGSRTMDQEHPQINVSTLADSTQISTLSTGMFTRRQTEIASEMTAGRKTRYLSDEGYQGSGSQQTNARDGSKPFHNAGLLGERFYLTFGLANMTFQLTDFRHKLVQQIPNDSWQIAVRIFDKSHNCGHDTGRSSGNHDAKLRQRTANRIYSRRASTYPGRSNTMQGS